MGSEIDIDKYLLHDTVFDVEREFTFLVYVLYICRCEKIKQKIIATDKRGYPNNIFIS